MPARLRGSFSYRSRVVTKFREVVPLNAGPRLSISSGPHVVEIAPAAGGRITRFAIANPEHAPYGRAAQEALMHAGLWDALKGKLWRISYTGK